MVPERNESSHVLIKCEVKQERCIIAKNSIICYHHLLQEEIFTKKSENIVLKLSLPNRILKIHTIYLHIFDRSVLPYQFLVRTTDNHRKSNGL